ncbi:MAG: hypothetical protein ACT4QC_09940 [Planctomycetaceae bacterium]
MGGVSDLFRQTLVPLLSVVGAIGLLIVAIYYLRSWWRDNAGPAASEHELLAHYRELNRQGELSDDEYRIIKGRIASRLGPTARPPGETRLPPAEKVEKS